MGVLDQVRETAALTASSATFVRVQHDAIEAYAASLPLEAARAPELDPATHFSGDPDATLAYVVQLDAINFGSGYFPELKKRAGAVGVFHGGQQPQGLFCRAWRAQCRSSCSG